jgi:hypothetical protein
MRNQKIVPITESAAIDLLDKIRLPKCKNFTTTERNNFLNFLQIVWEGEFFSIGLIDLYLKNNRFTGIRW